MTGHLWTSSSSRFPKRSEQQKTKQNWRARCERKLMIVTTQRKQIARWWSSSLSMHWRAVACGNCTSCSAGWGRWTACCADWQQPSASCPSISDGSPCPGQMGSLFHPPHSLQSIFLNPRSGSSYHKNIKLVEAAEGCLCDGPERENEADSGEGALAAG